MKHDSKYINHNDEIKNIIERIYVNTKSEKLIPTFIWLADRLRL